MMRMFIWKILIGTFLLLSISGCGMLEDDGGKFVLNKNKDILTISKSSKAALDGVKANPQKPYTVLIYMNGTDLESEYGAATEDLKEMINSKWKSDNVNVILLTGGTKKWNNNVISSNKTMIYRMDKNGFYEEVDLKSASIANPDTLSTFISYGLKAYPADQYSLIFWNHGGGPINGYGADQLNDGAGMSIMDIYKGIKNSNAKAKQFEFIGFDACLMASVENAYVLREFGKYFVASEELEPGCGWNYQWLKSLGDNPKQTGLETGKTITDLFIKVCEQYELEATLSVIDLDKVEQLASTLETFGIASNELLIKGQYNTLAKSRAKSKSFGYIGKNEYNFDLVDIYHLALKTKSILPKESDDLVNSVKSAVLYSKSTSLVKNSYGVMTYLPYATKQAAIGSAEFYKSIGIMTPYAKFLDNYAKTMNGKKISMASIEQAQPTTTKKGDVVITLPQKDLERIDKIKFVVWRELEPNSDYFIQLGMSSNVEVDPSGKIITKFDGYWTTLAGEPICLYEMERDGKDAKFSTPILLNGEAANLIVVQNDKNPDGKILGAVPAGPKNSKMAPKNLIKLKKGDKVTLQYYAELFLKNEKDMAKYDKTAKWVNGKEITVDKDIKLKVTPVDDKLYMYGYWITDTQSNNYYTKFVEIRY